MRITESQLRRIVREEARRLLEAPKGPGRIPLHQLAYLPAANRRAASVAKRMSPKDAAARLLDALGRSGAEELADAMYSATGTAARDAEERFADELRAVGAGRQADDPDWSSEAYSALVDLVNPWDAPRPVRESLLPGDEPYVVIGNQGRGVQVLWPSSAEPQALSREEAEAVAARLNRTLPSGRIGRVQWHFKPLSRAEEFVSPGQDASIGLAHLRQEMEEL